MLKSREKVLIPVKRTEIAPQPNTNEMYSDRAFIILPTILVVNATSLFKPAALQQLHADMMSLQVDVAIVTETWFKPAHKTELKATPGCNCYCHDRTGCKGGGVAVYSTESVDMQLYMSATNESNLELSGLKLNLAADTCI